MDSAICDEFGSIVAASTGRAVNPSDTGYFVSDHGFDLFDISEIAAAVEERFGFEIPDSDLASISSMTLAVRYIEERMKEIRSWTRSE